MSLIASVTSRAIDAPIVALFVLLAACFAAAALVTLWQSYRESVAAGPTTSDALRQDSATRERRARLRMLQGGRGARRIS